MNANTNPRPSRQSWGREVRESYGWSGAAIGSAGAIGLYTLTAWYMPLILCLLYTAFAVRSYRRAFVLPLVPDNDQERHD